jgi:hypothetical protein
VGRSAHHVGGGRGGRRRQCARVRPSRRVSGDRPSTWAPEPGSTCVAAYGYYWPGSASVATIRYVPTDGSTFVGGVPGGGTGTMFEPLSRRFLRRPIPQVIPGRFAIQRRRTSLAGEIVQRGAFTSP